MRRFVFAGALAVAVALSATAAAQESPTPQQPTSGSTAAQEEARPSAGAQAVTVEGCLKREADVPGRKPNVVERAGVTEDYILTNAKVVKGTPPAAAQARPGDTPVGTAGSLSAMYEVEGIDDEKLKAHVGHRVQLDGTFENVDRAGATPERGTPADDLVEIRATALRHVTGECSATPK